MPDQTPSYILGERDGKKVLHKDQWAQALLGAVPLDHREQFRGAGADEIIDYFKFKVPGYNHPENVLWYDPEVPYYENNPPGFFESAVNRFKIWGHELPQTGGAAAINLGQLIEDAVNYTKLLPKVQPGESPGITKPLHTFFLEPYFRKKMIGEENFNKLYKVDGKNIVSDFIKDQGYDQWKFGREYAIKKVYGEYDEVTGRFIGGDTKLRGYVQYTSENPFDITDGLQGQEFADAAMSVATSLASIVSFGIAGGPIGGISAAFSLEGSEAFGQAMQYLVDEKGLDPKDAMKVAAQAGYIYGGLSGVLEVIVPLSIAKSWRLSKSLSGKAFKGLLDDMVEAGTKTAKSQGKAGVVLDDVASTSAIRNFMSRQIPSIERGIEKIGKKIPRARKALGMSGLEAATEESQFIVGEFVHKGVVVEEPVSMGEFITMIGSSESQASIVGGLMGGGVFSVPSLINTVPNKIAKSIEDVRVNTFEPMVASGAMTEETKDVLLHFVKEGAIASATDGMTTEEESKFRDKIDKSLDKILERYQKKTGVGTTSETKKKQTGDLIDRYILALQSGNMDSFYKENDLSGDDPISQNINKMHPKDVSDKVLSLMLTSSSVVDRINDVAPELLTVAAERINNDAVKDEGKIDVSDHISTVQSLRNFSSKGGFSTVQDRSQTTLGDPQRDRLVFRMPEPEERGTSYVDDLARGRTSPVIEEQERTELERQADQEADVDAQGRRAYRQRVAAPSTVPIGSMVKLKIGPNKGTVGEVVGIDNRGAARVKYVSKRGNETTVSFADNLIEVVSDPIDYSAMVVKDLKAELKKRKLKVGGKKVELVDRLKADDAKVVTKVSDIQAPVGEIDTSDAESFANSVFGGDQEQRNTTTKQQNNVNDERPFHLGPTENQDSHGNRVFQPSDREPNRDAQEALGGTTLADVLANQPGAGKEQTHIEEESPGSVNDVFDLGEEGPRLLITGGRTYSNEKEAREALENFIRAYGMPSVLIHGDAQGADSLLGKIATEMGIPVQARPADWKDKGKAAGPIRNQEMIDLDKPTHVIAFPGGTGTADMTKKSLVAGLEVVKSSMLTGGKMLTKEQEAKLKSKGIKGLTTKETPFDDTGTHSTDENPQDRENFQNEHQTEQALISEDKELADKLAKRLNTHFGKIVTATQVHGLIERHGREYVGMAMENLVVWSVTDGRVDTIPHEYAHVYIDLMRDTPIVKLGFKMIMKSVPKDVIDKGLGAEELLVQYIGEYYANRIQDRKLKNRIRIWWKQFVTRLKLKFGKMKIENVDDIPQFIAEEFYQGRWVGEMGGFTEKTPRFQEADAPVDNSGAPTDAPPTSKSTTSVPSDVHMTEFFSTLFHIHIRKDDYVSNVNKFVNSSNNFSEFVEKLEKWLVKYSRTRPDRAGIILPSNLDANDGLELRQIYQREKAKIKVYASGKDNKHRQGKDTRIVRGVNFVGKGFSIYTAGREHRVSGIKLPESVTMNFFEQDYIEGKHSQRMIILPLNMFVREFTYKNVPEKVGQKFWVQGSTRLTTNVLKTIDSKERNDFVQAMLNGGNIDSTNLLFISGAKSGNNASMYMGLADFKEESLEDYEGYLAREVTSGFMPQEIANDLISVAQRGMVKVIGEANIELLNMSVEEVQTIAAKNVMSLTGFNKMTPESQKKKLLWETKKLLRKKWNGHALIGQMIGRHEWWKAARENNYLMNEKSVEDTFNRLSIIAAEGVAPVGAGDSGVMIIDTQTKVKVELDNGVVIDAGIYDDYDGSWITGTRFLNKMGKVLGHRNLRLLKTFIRHKGSNGIDFLGSKHMQFSPMHKRMTFWKVNEDGSETMIARTVGGSNNSRFEDANGAEFDHIASTNEAKLVSGAFQKGIETNAIHTLNDTDFHVIQVPSRTVNTGPFPIALGEFILDSMSNIDNMDSESKEAILNLINEIKNHYNMVGSEYTELLKAMRKNPELLREIVYKAAEENQLPTEPQKYLEMIGEKANGILHAVMIAPLIPYINNTMIRDGIFKGRRLVGSIKRKWAEHLSPIKGELDRNIGHPVATHTFLKPAAHLQIDDGSVIASGDNDVIFNEVKRAYMKERGLKDWRAENRFEEIITLNEWLKEKDSDGNFLHNVETMIHRQPISESGGIFFRRVQYLMPYGAHGEVIYLSTKDVKEILNGDWDGDTGFAEFVPDRLKDAVNRVIGSPAAEQRRKELLIDIFGPRVDSLRGETGSAANTMDMYEAVAATSAVSGSVGFIVNSKAVLHQLSYKGFEIDIGGVKYRIKDPSEEVIMDYIPIDLAQLDDGVLSQKISQNGDSLVYADKKGKWHTLTDKDISRWRKGEISVHLKTTVEYEFGMLLQMALDENKYRFLSRVNNGEAYSTNFIIGRMFESSDGKAPDDKANIILSSVRQSQSLSSQRQGRFGGTIAGMTANIEISMELYNRFYNDNDKQRSDKEVSLLFAQRVQEKIVKRYERYKRPPISPVEIAEILDSITMNNNVAPVEELLMMIGKAYKEFVDSYGGAETRLVGGNFFNMTDDMYRYLHYEAIIGSSDSFADFVNEISLSDRDSLNKGASFAKKLYVDFHEQRKALAKARRKKEPGHISPDYQDEFTKLIDRHIDAWNSLSENAQKIATMSFLVGLNAVYGMHLLPLDLMHHGIVNSYLGVYQKLENKLKGTEEIVQTGKVYERKEYKELVEMWTAVQRAASKVNETDSLDNKVCNGSR